MTTLIRCTTCKRHIYASESACPFCARNAISTSGSIAVALTAAASLALASCSNDGPKNDPASQVAPEANTTAATQTAAKPEPPPAPLPTPVASSPAPDPAPSASVATATPPPAVTQTSPKPNPNVSPVPAYGAPAPKTTTQPTRRPAAYGGPPRPNPKDPFSPR